MKDKKILIIEDEKSLSKIIGKTLEKGGFSVLFASSIEDAKKMIKNNKIHLIWLDHYLIGKEDGLDFVADLKKESSKFNKIPIFVVSNTATDKTIGAYLNLGVTKYYTKSDCLLCDVVDDIKKELL